MPSNTITPDSAPRPNWRIVGWTGALVLLLLPLLIMQFSSEMRWDAADFALFAIMIATAGLALEVAVKMTRTFALRLVIGAVVAMGFVLVWADAAVGVFPR